MTKRRAKKDALAETPSPESRDAQGRFLPGVSGCPGGRPKGAHEIIDLARVDSADAYAKVRAAMLNDDHRQQLAAAIAILKLAGVFRAAEDPKALQPPARNPFSDRPTEALLQAATRSSLPQ